MRVQSVTAGDSELAYGGLLTASISGALSLRLMRDSTVFLAWQIATGARKEANGA
jgi:hypothetical protein